MTKKWIAINMLLLLVAAITGRQLYVSVQEFKARNDLSKIEPDRSLNQKIAQETILPPPIAGQRFNASDFAVIPEKNLFLESRTMEGSTDSPVAAGIMPASQKPILVGVILTEDRRLASILEPRGRSRDSEVQLKRVGDEYAGYTVTEIESDHIVLDNGRQREIITLDDGSQTARRGKTNVVPTRVISIGGGATAGSIPVSVVAGGINAPQTPPASTARTVINSRTNNTVLNNAVPVAGIQPGGQLPGLTVQGSNQQQENTKTPIPQPTAKTTGGVQRDPRVIRTPFGDIIRPDPQ